jgi:hypothetical protein
MIMGGAMSYYHGQGLGKHLIAEGICPENANNVELHVPVDGAVFIRYDVLVTDDDIPKLQRALGRLMEERKEFKEGADRDTR